MTQEQRDDVYYEAIMIVNELHKTIDYAVYSRLIDLIDILGLPAETCTVEPSKPARLDENGLVPCGCGNPAEWDTAMGGIIDDDSVAADCRRAGKKEK